MLSYIVKRLMTTVVVVICVAFLIFTIMYLTPGDPARMILGSGATIEELDSMREYLHLDDPYLKQLGDFMYSVFIKFDFGDSWKTNVSINTDIARKLPITAGIALYSVIISTIIGVPLGVAAAVNQDKLIDKLVLGGSSIMRCIPNFWIALMLVLIFALKLNWLPAYGIDQGIKSYILPCITIMLGSFAWTSRQMRSSMLEVIRSDYVVAAKAQGFSKMSVYYRHALPNALIPIITIMGTQFAVGLGGTIILETIFSIPGMGMYIQNGIGQRDIPVVTGSVVMLGIMFCLIMLLVDILYALADPRIKAQYRRQGMGKGGKVRAKA
jgi:peptide/nickel transport system permease protein